jgi:hypothetical protein
MPSYDWHCQVCDSTNPSSASICTQCGCPDEVNALEIEARKRTYVPGTSRVQTTTRTSETEPKSEITNHRPDGSNIVPIKDLINSLFLTVIGVWLAWSFFKGEKAVFTFSKHAHTYIEVSGIFSSLLGSLAMLTLASSSISIIADHFDRRANEPAYKKFNKYCLIAFVVLTILAILVGWKLEHIQVLHK